MRHALAEAKETAAARADEGVGFTAKDAAPLWSAYQEALDKRIKAEAAPAMAAVYSDLGRDYWEEGYTEEDVDTGCAALNKVAKDVFGLPGEVAVMWNENDEWTGFGGDSELVYLHQRPIDPDNPERTNVEAYSLSIPFHGVSATPDDFIADLRSIAWREAEPNDVYPGDSVAYDGYNWGPWEESDREMYLEEEDEVEDGWRDFR